MTHSLLTFPAEVRVKIYKALFAGLVLSPACIDLGRGLHAALIREGQSPRTSLIKAIAIGLESEPDWDRDLDLGEYISARLRRPVDLGILRACREIYDEAYPVLLRVATFKLASIEDHTRFTQPQMLPILARIRSLSVTSAVVPEWSPTLVRLVLPSISHFEIRDLQAQIPHDHMVCVESLRSHDGGPPRAEAYTVPTLLQALLSNTIEGGLITTIFSHFAAAPHMYECLVLHFLIECDWTLMPPHDHSAKNMVFVFGERRVWTQGGRRLSTLAPAQWDQTAFVYRSGFSMENKAD
ncbi:hypothetical protein CLCR_08928 [Cladophialophora carrionii]|uniref:DUF7730 domain-containing protein n=1 Tax=Cladophialophora carrionii TaxID=86049 RepID=A0A1C1CSA3_9EURO|nr:hypothetical protein CLCR_08928 [Cladophialophora carrionii]